MPSNWAVAPMAEVSVSLCEDCSKEGRQADIPRTERRTSDLSIADEFEAELAEVNTCAR